MSPAVDALFPGWVDIFFGRQSIRTIHFVVAWALGAVRDNSRVYGNRQRLLEQSSLDDYRILQSRIGGGS